MMKFVRDCSVLVYELRGAAAARVLAASFYFPTLFERRAEIATGDVT